MRSRLLQKLTIHRSDHGSKNPTRVEANNGPEPASGPSVSSQTHKATVPKPRIQATDSEESKQDSSLWDQAYAKLDNELVEAYERLLSEELPTSACCKQLLCFRT
jgi:hypothetical protein